VNKSDLEELFWFQIRAVGLDRFVVRELVFAKDRKYRLDFAHLLSQVAVEIQGGIWKPGGHNTGVGISRDCEKLSLAASLGWRVLPVTGRMVEDGTALNYFERTIDMCSERIENESDIQRPE